MEIDIAVDKKCCCCYYCLPPMGDTHTHTAIQAVDCRFFFCSFCWMTNILADIVVTLFTTMFIKIACCFGDCFLMWRPSRRTSFEAMTDFVLFTFNVQWGAKLV